MYASGAVVPGDFRFQRNCSYLLQLSVDQNIVRESSDASDAEAGMSMDHRRKLRNPAIPKTGSKRPYGAGLAGMTVLVSAVLSTIVCTYPVLSQVETPEKQKFAATHVIRAAIDYYTDGPQQGRPADGKLHAGTKVRDLGEPSGTYAHVVTENNLTCYVAKAALKPIN